MSITGHELASVDPMQIRQFRPIGMLTPRPLGLWRGVLVMENFEVTDGELAKSRLSYDEAVIDCSHRVLEITSSLCASYQDRHLTLFPSRRWRNFREGEQILQLPTSEQPLLYLGNPIVVTVQAKAADTEIAKALSLTELAPAVWTNTAVLVQLKIRFSSDEFILRPGYALGY